VVKKYDVTDILFVPPVDYEPAVNEVAVPVLTRELCNSWLEENDVNVTESMICAGYPEGGRDACQVNAIKYLCIKFSLSLSLSLNCT
jgi:hypothetical protein